VTLPHLLAARRLDLPLPAILLAVALGGVAVAASAAIVITPFDAALFGGLTVPTVLGAGVLDGLNPCAFALLVLFATYTLTLVNSVTSDGSPTALARRRLLGAGSLYVGAVWITYFLIGLGLFAFLSWLGEDHLITRIAAILALVMALWMVKDILLPGWGPALAAPHATHGWMHRAMERGGLGGMLLAGVLVGICTVPCSGAIYLDIVAVLNASGGGSTGLALLALYNIAYILPLVALPERAAWPYLGASSIIHIGYFFSLVGAYRAGDLSHGYPIMRGVAPLLVAVSALTWFGEAPSPATWTGIALICGGVLSLGLAGFDWKHSRAATGWALANAAIIACYTIVDATGVRDWVMLNTTDSLYSLPVPVQYPLGAGVRWSDDDLKYLLGSIPSF